MFQLSVIDLKILLCLLFSMGITFFMIPSIVEMSNLKSLTALPNKRTSHDSAVPNLGGIAIFIGLIISYLLFLRIESFPRFQYLIAATMIIFFVGFKDDIMGLNPYKKFFGEIVAAWIIVSFGAMRLTSLHGFFGIYEMDYALSYVVTLVAIIGITNCFNLMDGIDGLSAGLGIIACIFFGVWFYLVKDYEWTKLSFAMAGSLLAFGFFNVFGHKNKIFMGDTGSLTIGFLMAVIAIHFNEENLEPVIHFHVNAAPAVSIGILMVPLFDTLRVLFTRLVRNQSPFMPDRTHIHHYLLDLGFSHLKATLILLATSIFFGGVSFLLKDLGVVRLLVVLFALAGGSTAFVIYLVRRRKTTH